MRAQVFGVVIAVASIIGLGWLLLNQVATNGALQERVAATEQALEQTTQAMHQLDAMHRAADQALADNRQRHNDINQQLQGQINALRSELASAVCTAADLPDAAADRLRSITGAAGAGD